MRRKAVASGLAALLTLTLGLCLLLTTVFTLLRLSS